MQYKTDKAPSGVGVVKIKSPATVANLVCGFDILGLALNDPYDTMTLVLKDEPGIIITHTDLYDLPTDPLKNICGVALQAMINATGFKKGFDLVVHKHIKPGSGIGSSAASAAGVVVAANELMQTHFSKKQLVDFAMEGEVLASGARHADNIAPCIYGGITLIRDTATLDIISIPAPTLFVTIVHPQIEIKTSYAREILPTEVPLKSAVKQWANVAGLIAGFQQNDYDLISRSLEDIIVEPVRSKLIPGFDEVKTKCKEAGVLGGGISGSGPSIFMLSKDKKEADVAAEIMKDVYRKIGIDFKTYVSTVNTNGVTITN
jgi:homoserine kinase